MVNFLDIDIYLQSLSLINIGFCIIGHICIELNFYKLVENSIIVLIRIEI